MVSGPHLFDDSPRALSPGEGSAEQLSESPSRGLACHPPSHSSPDTSLLHSLNIPKEPRDGVQNSARSGDPIPPSSCHGLLSNQLRDNQSYDSCRQPRVDCP